VRQTCWRLANTVSIQLRVLQLQQLHNSTLRGRAQPAAGPDNLATFVAAAEQLGLSQQLAQHVPRLVSRTANVGLTECRKGPYAGAVATWGRQPMQHMRVQHLDPPTQFATQWCQKASCWLAAEQHNAYATLSTTPTPLLVELPTPRPSHWH
jgi:hypothetical protein